MLRDGQKAVSYLRNTDEESEIHTVAFWWLNICCTRLNTFKNRLALDNVMLEDKATQASAEVESICAIDEPKSSSRRYIRK
jgi:hypothetical protein